MNIKDVEKLAEQAKLELTEVEKEQLLKDMEGILTYVRQVEKVEVSEIDIKHQQRNVWREDKTRGEHEVDFSKEFITSQFPDSQDGFVKVNKIL
ncbi:MAG: Asp-tRNA(Asn)/Glu-tRNA(Gln) amidotransferase subunit GatC [bacterium]|nr:Asp-tRNA(Asn)/Glu-tRNA(Gln) amidotransferase subunit GatC [bacterium]